MRDLIKKVLQEELKGKEVIIEMSKLQGYCEKNFSKISPELPFCNAAENYTKNEIEQILEFLYLGFSKIKSIENNNNINYNTIYNFEINPNTQFFLNKFSSDETSNFKIWDKLCCDQQINGFNIMYVNLDNKKTDTTGYSCNKKRYSDIYEFDKSNIFTDKINYNITNFKLLNKDKDILLNFSIDDQDKSVLTESYNKLLFKISKCKINQLKKVKWINRFNTIKLFLEDKISKFSSYIKDKTLSYLLDNYPILQSYLLNVKIYNLIDKLLKNIDNEEAFCSIIKNYKNLFDTKKTSYSYKFEILFELINGNEILKEQMERYQIMLERFKDVQKGGTIERDLTENFSSLINIKYNMDLDSKQEYLEPCYHYYQLHHFMMGKGKSAIITPLLSLHLNIIKGQKIYIIVPKHLVKQTQSTLRDYIDIFQIKDIYIKSEDDIKKEFLEGKFIENINIVFLIDEFDSLMNPLKSNFNYVEKSVIETINISRIIRNIINNYK